MKDSIEKKAILEIPSIFASFLGLSEKEVEIVPHEGSIGPDFLVKASGYQFLVKCKSTAARAPLFMALHQIEKIGDSFPKDAIPLIVVPFMGKSGEEFCEEHKLSWIDLSGNAHIKSPGFLIHIEGRPNRFKNVGRPANVFAPKSARIVRELLIEPGKRYNQRELSQTTGLDEGHTSRVIRRLERLNLIVRDNQGALRPLDPKQLLDAWLEVYDFSNHQIIKGHIAARSGVELLKRMSPILTENQIDYAVTGLAGAWQINHFANFRLTTVYLANLPGKSLYELLGFREDDRGANTWLVVPNDKGVFHGSAVLDNVVCAHPVQVYLDLKDHPERAKEASSVLLLENIKWDLNG